ncbi:MULTISPECIES: hypothetical protein [unclassified Roseateles]|uniref:hypothetical protein n=1 Tax=unclassified Roseateles TaxID=2626991 RepID=UPI000700B3FB|nr:MULTISPECIES: hypothetical protein [unclassified Roseateles]KQW46529.1 hypothetical protein ASC81_09005 [Pelomonas sp. Root405]KRA73580.1 hypothetical protein ASD88_09005 [Pelomonas sp. Root662]
MSERQINDPQSTPPAAASVDASASRSGRGKINTSRRHFAKSGAAAPVVLGSLLSKPALALQPYNCTISGQMSGNTSPRPGAVNCKAIGRSPGYWKTNGTWPTGTLKGNSPTSGCSFSGSKGTNFNGFSSGGATLMDAFRYKSENSACNCYGLRDSPFANCASTNKASMLQVLNTPGGLNDTMIYALGRATVATILNSIAFAPDYPVTTAQAIKMFNAVAPLNGKYQVNATVSWDANQVLTYFQSLYS